MPTTSYMGGQVRRREDPRLITGSATYVDDIVLPNMAYLAVLRSPYPHARIVRIDASAALERPGVLAVITGDEVEDLVPPQQGVGEGGPPPRQPLATGTVRYICDGVLALVATDRALAEDALERVSGERIRVVAAGRTDSGVHARAQVLSFRSEWKHSPGELQRAWNVNLPAAIAIRSLAVTDEGFDARRSARANG